jgi:hypothetical protein
LERAHVPVVDQGPGVYEVQQTVSRGGRALTALSDHSSTFAPLDETRGGPVHVRGETVERKAGRHGTAVARHPDGPEIVSPADGASTSGVGEGAVPAAFLEPGTEYELEFRAIAESGNQTFRTIFFE